MPFEVQLIEFFRLVPHWLATILLSATPIIELRGAIPIGIGIYGMDPVNAYIFSVIGNMLPVIPLLLFLGPVSTYLRRFKIWDMFFSWLFTRTHHKHSERFERYGTLALTLFVAIPLPVTGAWTGCAAAFVFGIKFPHALFAISAGVAIAGLIVTAITISGISIMDLVL